VRIEQLPSRRLVNRLSTGGYGQVAFAGDHLLVQGTSGNLEVWSEDGAERQQMIGGIGLGQVIGSPDGRLAASVGGEDGMIHLIDLETGGVVATFETPAHLSALKTGLAFSPDGKRLVAVSELLSSETADLDPDTAELVSRELSDASLVSVACEAAGQELTATEWQAFVGNGPPGDLRCK
jgi:WD40 repeat protein